MCHRHDIRQLVERDEAGAQAVVDIVIVIGDLIGHIRDLRFERRLPASEKALAEIAEPARVFTRTMLEDAFARFKAEIEAVERAVVLFELIDDGEALQVVLEAAVIAHAFVQRILARVAEWRMTQIVRKRNRFDEILVHPQVARDRTRDLRHFEAVREPRAKQVALVIDEDLRLVFEPAKRGGMHDAVAIALEFGARGRRLLGVTPAARSRGMGGVRREMRFQRERRGRSHEDLTFCFAHRLLRIIVCPAAAVRFRRLPRGSRAPLRRVRS